MKQAHLWSLRLGFSNKQSNAIAALGLEEFLKKSVSYSDEPVLPSTLKNTPRTLAELKAFRQEKRNSPDKKVIVQDYIRYGWDLKSWWLQRMNESEFPLREKMNLLWSNHFVSTYQKVKIPYYIFEHYSIINKHAFGNYKTLVKEMMYSNAMIMYLSNNQNRKGNINENLARELLELFTLGEGHYTESDIKNTARALAGLTIGDDKGQYRKFITDTDFKTVFDKTGDFKIDEVVDIIFEQKNTPYFITEKILKWFIYDNPSQELIQFYGNQMKSLNFEIAPFLTYVFTKEFEKETAGSQIKNPLVFMLQLCDSLTIEEPNYKFLAFVLKNQGMDLFDQPNVKGWDGGKSWLSSQLYLNRNQLVDLFTNGNTQFVKKIMKQFEKYDIGSLDISPSIDFDSSQNAKGIINDLSSKLIFEANEDIMDDMSQLLKYDFNPKAENSEENVLRLFSYIAKTPEFQII